jgi:hypothetical protein
MNTVSLNPGAILPFFVNCILKNGVVGGMTLSLCENFDLLIISSLTFCFLFNSKPVNFTILGEASKRPFDENLS